MEAPEKGVDGKEGVGCTQEAARNALGPATRGFQGAGGTVAPLKVV